MSLRLASLVLACPLLLAGTALRSATLEEYVARAPFHMPAVPLPSFPNRTFPITAYGAVGDGRTLNTQAFAHALAACAASGGGHVIIPPGLWLTGPIDLRSNVDLHSEHGALILFTPDHSAYAMVRRLTFGFVTLSPIDFVPESPINGVGLKNVALTGDGIFDGAGDSWRPMRKANSTEAQWQAVVAKGGVVSNNGTAWWPTQEAMQGENYLIQLSRRNPHPTAEDALPGRDFRRPPLVYLDGCDRVLIQGVTLRNSPSGDLGPSRCANLTIRDVTLFNEWWAATGDGMDVNTCQNVLVYHCTVSAGDDAICFKSSGYSPLGHDAALRNVIVAECTVYRGHGGFVLGGYTEDGMRNVWATNCDFDGTDVGIRIKSGLGHGGLVRDVTVDHIFMKDIVGAAILFDTHYVNVPTSAIGLTTVWWSPNGVPLPDDPAETPEFSDFRFHDIYCAGAGTAIAITGLPQRPVHRISIENSVITAAKGFHAADATDIVLKNVRINTPESPAVVTRDTARIQILN